MEPGACCLPKGGEGVEGPQRAGAQADGQAVCRGPSACPGAPAWGAVCPGPLDFSKGCLCITESSPHPLPSLLSHPAPSPSSLIFRRFPGAQTLLGTENEVDETPPLSLQGPRGGGSEDRR